MASRYLPTHRTPVVSRGPPGAEFWSPTSWRRGSPWRLRPSDVLPWTPRHVPRDEVERPNRGAPMRRIGLAVVLALSLIFAPLVGGAQQAGKVYHVGVLSSGGDTAEASYSRREFLERLSALG